MELPYPATDNPGGLKRLFTCGPLVSKEALSHVSLNDSQSRHISMVIQSAVSEDAKGVWATDSAKLLIIATYIQSLYHPTQSAPTKNVPAISTETQKKVDATLG